LHKDKGAITNIVPIQRPLSLYGLTANMSGYEPNQIKSLQRQLTSYDSIGVLPINIETKYKHQDFALERQSEYEQINFLASISKHA